jgi:hypothetical protein
MFFYGKGWNVCAVRFRMGKQRASRRMEAAARKKVNADFGQRLTAIRAHDTERESTGA